MSQSLLLSQPDTLERGWRTPLCTPFVLDTNVFIEAPRRYYAPDLCPGFWKCLTHYCHEGRVLSIDRVRNEILGSDALAQWVKNAPDNLFVSSDEELVADAFLEMMAWVQGNSQSRFEERDSRLWFCILPLTFVIKDKIFPPLIRW